MLPKSWKIVISILLSILSIVLFIVYGGKVRKHSMIAMLLCTIADLFMVDAFGLADISTYIGAVVFMAGHVFYGTGFLKSSKAKSYAIKNKGFFSGLALVIVATIILGVLTFTIPDKVEPILFIIIVVYIAIIGYNLVMQFSYAYSEKGKRYMLVVAMTLFIISDFLVALDMLSIIAQPQNDLVWATYIPAQAFIILFCDELSKTKLQKVA